MIIKLSEVRDVIDQAFLTEREFLLPLKGDSMLPFFKTGDKAILKRANHIKRLDALLYIRSNGDYVFHRLIRIDGDKLWMTGDHQAELECIETRQVLGKLVGYVKHGKVYQKPTLRHQIAVRIWSVIWIRRILLKLGGSIKR